MGAYTFELSASVTVHARNEHEARQKLIDECLIQDEDVEYGKGLGVYLSLEEAMDAELVEINLEDE